MHRYLFATVFFLAATASRSLCAQSSTPLNLTWRTLGGEQLWSDERVYGKWRIQHNVVTDHYRLLDPGDVRRAWGTAEQCRAALDDLKRTEMIPQLDGLAVLTLHGLGRSRDHMAEIGAQLENHGGFTWINVAYASTRRSLDDHAESLARVIEGLEGIDEIHFVCHSLGNLVVRRYLGEASLPSPRWKVDPRIKRMVMLGPPNNGARLAEVVADAVNEHELVRLLAGPSSWQLAREWNETQKLLATPRFEFAIIAGGLGDDQGFNPLLPGDDDLIVRVEETRLCGAADFRIVNSNHRRLAQDSAVHQFILSFLERGHFTTAAERQPIAHEAVPARDKP